MRELAATPKHPLQKCAKNGDRLSPSAHGLPKWAIIQSEYYGLRKLTNRSAVYRKQLVDGRLINLIFGHLISLSLNLYTIIH